MAFILALMVSVPGYVGPGWYQIGSDGFQDDFIISGPFKTEAACKRTLPKLTEFTYYVCMKVPKRSAHFPIPNSSDRSREGS